MNPKASPVARASRSILVSRVAAVLVMLVGASVLAAAKAAEAAAAVNNF